MAEAAGYDIIGDVHEHAAELEALLHKLNYRKQGARGVVQIARRC